MTLKVTNLFGNGYKLRRSEHTGSCFFDCEELAQKNERLTEYAFYNAHKLRAPFCRIKGLVQLKAISTPDEQGHIDGLMQAELEELDKLIREIQRIVSG
ncbi:MAG: hypothetical protein ACKOE6_11020 [Flammeovirgaceae bacterium]